MGKDFREGWTVRGKLKWHFFYQNGDVSSCGYGTRDGTGILAGIHGVGKGGHCKRCLKIYEKEHPDEEAFRINTGYPVVERVEIKEMDVNDEITDLIKLIKQLDNLREEHTITYEGLHKVTGIMQDYAWETARHFPLHKTEAS